MSFLIEMGKEGDVLVAIFREDSMEIDRKNSNKEYTADNIVLCCYWCNNAKSDEFTFDEFKKYIAPGINQTWNDRLRR